MSHKERRNNGGDSGAQQPPPRINDLPEESSLENESVLKGREGKPRSLDQNRRLGNKVSIRISAQDSFALRKQALDEGIPYHSLVANIIHEYVKQLNIPTE